MSSLAILSDIHGNIWALEAVLQDLARRDIQAILNLGDTIYGPLAPAATAERLMPLNPLSVRGNEDRIIIDPKAENSSPTLDYVTRDLKPRHLNWLITHPATYIFEDEIFLCHGTPASDETYLLEGLSNQGGFLLDEAVIKHRLGNNPQKVILCGHSHIPRTVRLADGTIIVNPGSVGLPAYTDDSPQPHKMECGSPHSRYALLNKASSGWQVEHVVLPYDWQTASQAALRNGREDWAKWLTSGRA